MEVIHKQFIGQDTEICMVYSKGGYSVSICIDNLKNYCSQLYQNFNNKEEAEKFYFSLVELKEQLSEGMKKSEWVIETRCFQEHHFEYYTGKSYICQGQYYLVFDKDVKEAKKYSSKKRAMNAMNKLQYKFVNSVEMKVVELVSE